MIARKYIEDKRLGSKLWFTVISISLMRNFFKDEVDKWQPFEEKAIHYLESIKALEKLDEYLEEANQRVLA